MSLVFSVMSRSVQPVDFNATSLVPLMPDHFKGAPFVTLADKRVFFAKFPSIALCRFEKMTYFIRRCCFYVSFLRTNCISYIDYVARIKEFFLPARITHVLNEPTEISDESFVYFTGGFVRQNV